MSTPTVWLSREERRERARADRAPTTASSARRCAFCYGPVADGEVVCSETCDEGAWQITPTVDGELWEPLARPVAVSRRGGVGAGDVPAGQERAL